MLTRHADCVAVLRDHARFSTDWTRVGEKVPPAARSIQSLDPPDQTPVRRLFVDAIRRRDGEDLEREVARQARTLLAPLATRDSFDFVTEVAEPLALATITYLLGIEQPDLTWFVPIADAISDGMDGRLWPERLAPATAARTELAELAGRWLASAPDHGVVGYVAREAAGAGVDQALVATTTRVMLHAGYTSVSKLLSLSAVALLERPDGLERFRGARPALAADELARYTSLVQGVARACVTDTEISGTAIRAGDAVTMLLGAANRDPARFPEPEELRLERTPNPHLGFGRGTHACPGSPTALRQSWILFSIIAELYPTARMTGPPEFRRNLTQRTVDRFEVALK